MYFKLIINNIKCPKSDQVSLVIFNTALKKVCVTLKKNLLINLYELVDF